MGKIVKIQQGTAKVKKLNEGEDEIYILGLLFIKRESQVFYTKPITSNIIVTVTKQDAANEREIRLTPQEILNKELQVGDEINLALFLMEKDLGADIDDLAEKFEEFLNENRADINTLLDQAFGAGLSGFFANLLLKFLRLIGSIFDSDDFLGQTTRVHRVSEQNGTEDVSWFANGSNANYDPITYSVTTS